MHRKEKKKVVVVSISFTFNANNSTIIHFPTTISFFLQFQFRSSKTERISKRMYFALKLKWSFYIDIRFR